MAENVELFIHSELIVLSNKAQGSEEVEPFLDHSVQRHKDGTPRVGIKKKQ